MTEHLCNRVGTDLARTQDARDLAAQIDNRRFDADLARSTIQNERNPVPQFFLNMGGAGFTATTPYSSMPGQCTGPVQAAIYDIDRDGRLDVGVLCQTGIGLLINQTGQ